MKRLKMGQRPRCTSTCTNILLPPHWCQPGWNIVMSFFFFFPGPYLVVCPSSFLLIAVRWHPFFTLCLPSSFNEPPVDSGPDAVPFPELNTIVFYIGNKLSTPPVFPNQRKGKPQRGPHDVEPCFWQQFLTGSPEIRGFCSDPSLSR